jgi:hypothetical protein
VSAAVCAAAAAAAALRRRPLAADFTRRPRSACGILLVVYVPIVDFSIKGARALRLAVISACID